MISMQLSKSCGVGLSPALGAKNKSFRGEIHLKYIVEVIEPQYVEVDANSEEQAIQIVKNSIQDPRVRDYIRLQVCKEIVINS